MRMISSWILFAASGPGGQNVNKVATAVQLRFDVNHASLPPDVRDRLVRLAGSRMTHDGILIIKAARFRTQEGNRQDAVERLVQLVRRAVRKPVPRIKTRPSRASKERQKATKRHRSRIKKQTITDRRKESYLKIGIFGRDQGEIESPAARNFPSDPTQYVGHNPQASQIVEDLKRQRRDLSVSGRSGERLLRASRDPERGQRSK